MSSFFVTGGTMKPDAPSYVHRAADEELYTALLAGEYCSVLTTRQMGKSSLMARTAVRLREQGVRCATVDLQGRGQKNTPPEQWYYGFVKQVADGLELSGDWPEWWKKQEKLLPVQRMTDFFTDVVLKQIGGRVVVFIDEVDWMIRLPFSDEFFAAIRSCYNRRATESEFDRLSFVLLGSAAPAQLIKDATRTPFNIGRGIELTDFTPEEARILAQPLGVEGETILSRILYWTDGHPYLTQMLLAKVMGADQVQNPAEIESFVDRVIERELLTSKARLEENNLKFVGDRLTQGTRNLRKVLRVYRDVLHSKPVQDLPTSPIHTSLRLSGVVKPNAERRLQVRNRVYCQVFDQKWVQEKMPNDLRLVIGVSTAALFIAVLSFWYLMIFPRSYVHDLEIASNDPDIAYNAYNALQKPFHRAKASELLAQFWERRGDRDAAILIRARAGDGSSLAELIGGDYGLLRRTFRHQDGVKALAFSPDGELVAIAYHDNMVWVSAVVTGREVSRLVSQKTVNALAFTSDSKLVAVVSDDNTARVFEVATRRETVRIEVATRRKILGLEADARLNLHYHYNDNVKAAAFSPDSKLLATASSDNTARVFEVATKREILRLIHQSTVNAVAFSPDGKLLATASSDNTARVFEVATKREILRLIHQRTVNAVAFSPDGKLLATASSDNMARVFEVATKRGVLRLIHQNTVNAVAFSPDGKLVATGSWGNQRSTAEATKGTAHVFEVSTGREISRLAHQTHVTALGFNVSSGLVITASDDNTVRMFEVATGKEVSQPVYQALTALAFSLDGRLVATESWDNTLRVFESATGRELLRFANVRYRSAMAFSPNSKLVATQSSDWTDPTTAARVFETATGRKLSQLTYSQNGEFSAIYLFLQARPNAMSFSSDGKLVATTSWNNAVYVFEATTGREVSRLLPQSTVLTVAFSPDGKLVATGSWAKDVQVFEVATGRELSRYIHQNVVTLAFSPDGKQVATGSLDHTVRVFEVATGRELSHLVHQRTVSAVAYNPDGQLLVTQTGNWLHLYRRESDNWRPITNRHIPFLWPGMIHFLSPDAQCPRCVEILRDVPGNLLEVDKIDFDKHESQAIQGRPKDLVKEWSERLGLTFDSQGRIVSLNEVQHR